MSTNLKIGGSLYASKTFLGCNKKQKKNEKKKDIKKLYILWTPVTSVSDKAEHFPDP